MNALYIDDSPDTFACEGCEQQVTDGDRSECSHMPLCNGCYGEHFCLDCAREDHFYDEVDRQYAAHKDGDRW